MAGLNEGGGTGFPSARAAASHASRARSTSARAFSRSFRGFIQGVGSRKARSQVPTGRRRRASSRMFSWDQASVWAFRSPRDRWRKTPGGNRRGARRYLRTGIRDPPDGTVRAGFRHRTGPSGETTDTSPPENSARSISRSEKRQASPSLVRMSRGMRVRSLLCGFRGSTAGADPLPGPAFVAWMRPRAKG
jgi:hypothetical protein